MRGQRAGRHVQFLHGNEYGKFLLGSTVDNSTRSSLEVVLGWPQLLEKGK